MTTDCRLVRCCTVGILECLGVLRLSVVSRQAFVQAAWHPELEQTILVVLTLGPWKRAAHASWGPGGAACSCFPGVAAAVQAFWLSGINS